MVVYADGTRVDGQAVPQGARVLVLLAGPSEVAGALALAGLDVATDPVSTQNVATRYEARTGYDFLTIRPPDLASPELAPLPAVNAWLGADVLVLEDTGNPDVAALAGRFEKAAPGAAQPVAVLYGLFNQLFTGDADTLEDVEEELVGLEALVVQDQPRNCTSRIMAIRRRLLVLKRYYEAVYDLLEDLEENLNGFIPKQRLHSFRIHTNRADRLAHTVLNLRDYATQVREAYQNQLDISLNQTMKLFTVITAIFLPLTLIAGWFGMNLQMPEYHLPWVYPVVIAACVAIVAGLLVYFKKKKWF